jgi:hypothetical protein
MIALLKRLLGEILPGDLRGRWHRRKNGSSRDESCRHVDYYPHSSGILWQHTRRLGEWLREQQSQCQAGCVLMRVEPIDKLMDQPQGEPLHQTNIGD